jgi:hypothetical protein
MEERKYSYTHFYTWHWPLLEKDPVVPIMFEYVWAPELILMILRNVIPVVCVEIIYVLKVVNNTTRWYEECIC